MRKFISFFVSGALLASTLVSLTPSSASAATTLITCTDLTNQKTVALKESQKSCRPLLATAFWRIEQSDSSAHTGAGYANLRTCTSKRAEFNYQLIKSKCAKYQVTNDYWRSAALPAKPVITEVSSYGHESVFLTLASESATNTDAPIAYYTITSSKGDVNKVNSWRELRVTVSGLRSSTSYTFTITATSVDGTSPVSESSLPVTTQTYVAPVAAATSAPLAAPAFALSASAETKTVNTAATGFTISSTGGTIASFAINATPAGMSFSTITGALTGTPNTVASATAYTITATNASGSATQTFTLTVTSIVYTVGQTGPGGGKIFYVVTTPFACGPTLATTCTYLEAAPTTGTNPWTDAGYVWSGNTNSSIGTTGTAIGTGYKNTLAMINQSNTADRAGTISQAYRGPNNLTDWFLPSKDELNQLYAQKTTVGMFVADFYWSSSEDDANFAWGQFFYGGFQNYDGKYLTHYVRPVRAF